MPTKAVAVQLLLDGYVAAYGAVEDISLDGARLALGEAFPSAEEIEIRIAAEDHSARSFHTTAMVVWCRPATSAEGRTHWGVRWTHFPRSAKHVLEALIAATCKEV